MFSNLEDLRQELLEIVEERMDEKDSISYVLATARFEFIRSQIVIFDTLKRPTTPKELSAFMPTLSTGSIFYHFIDARRRHENHIDDFSLWLSSYGDCYQDLCQQLGAIDPYFGSLGQIKNQLTDVFTAYFS